MHITSRQVVRMKCDGRARARIRKFGKACDVEVPKTYIDKGDFPFTRLVQIAFCKLLVQNLALRFPFSKVFHNNCFAPTVVLGFWS